MVGIALCAATLLSLVRSVAADAATCTALLTPRTCYERYLQAIQHAVALRDLHPYLSRELKRSEAAVRYKAHTERISLARK
jgi:hypothetical protein